MDKKQSLELCAALSNAKGAPGFEDEVLTVLRRYGEGLGSFREDSLRNLYLSRRGNQGGRPMVQLDAHTDEVAFMVQAVKPNGTLRFTTLGGWVPSNIPAHRVWVQTADGDYIPGVTASKPPHFMSEAERKAQPAVEDMSIDIGASSREEVLRDFRVRMAAPVVPDVTFEYQEKHDLMIGKAFDCRLGCASILRTLDNLRDKTLNVDVTGAFAVQEEMGTRGATVTANTVKPDLAIVFEGCPADDTVAEPYMIQTAIHKGPMLRHIDARMITNPASSAMPWIWRRSWASPCRRACAPAALPTARPSICPTRACPSSSSASLCVTSIPTTASPPTATWRTPPGWPPPFWSGWTPRRSAASESQSCAPMGAQLFC